MSFWVNRRCADVAMTRAHIEIKKYDARGQRMIQGMMMSAFQTRVTRDWINYRTLCIHVVCHICMWLESIYGSLWNVVYDPIIITIALE